MKSTLYSCPLLLIMKNDDFTPSTFTLAKFWLKHQYHHTLVVHFWDLITLHLLYSCLIFFTFNIETKINIMVSATTSRSNIEITIINHKINYMWLVLVVTFKCPSNNYAKSLDRPSSLWRRVICKIIFHFYFCLAYRFVGGLNYR